MTPGAVTKLARYSCRDKPRTHKTPAISDGTNIPRAPRPIGIAELSRAPRMPAVRSDTHALRNQNPVILGAPCRDESVPLRRDGSLASVIVRLLKNQNPSENRNNLRTSSPHPGPGQTSGEPRHNSAVRNSSTREPWLFRSPVFGSGIRRLDGRGGRRPPREHPA